MTDPDDVGRDEGEQARHDQFVEAQRAEFDIDEANIPAVPDITRGEPDAEPIEVGFEDPLLPAFSYQHDLRERFLTALREAVELLRGVDIMDPSPTQELVEKAREVIEEALDPEAIRLWNLAGRPLPSIPQAVAERGEAIDTYVGSIYERAGLARFNIWAYDPMHDFWVIVDGTLNTYEARETLAARSANQGVGVEHIMLPIGEVPVVE